MAYPLSLKEIMECLPHRYPFLMLDRVLALEPGEYCQGIKNVSIDSPILLGHFPGYPVMPGVMILEALAQTAGLAAVHYYEGKAPRMPFLTGAHGFRFKKQVMPGDQLFLDTSVRAHKLDLWSFNVKATVEEQLVCQGEIRIMTQLL